MSPSSWLPASSVQRTRLVAVLIALTVNLPLLAQLDHSLPPARQSLTLLTMLAMSANFVLTYRRRRALALDWLLPAVGIVIIGTGLLDPFAMTAMCFVGLIAQSQYGSRRLTVLRAVAIMASFPLTVALNPDSLGRQIDWYNGAVLSLLPFMAMFCWMSRSLHRTLVDQELAAAREAGLAQLGRELIRSDEIEEVRGLAAQCGIDLCAQTPGSVLLVLLLIGEELVVDTAIDADGIGEAPPGLQLPTRLLSVCESAENAVAVLDIDPVTALALDTFAPAAAPRRWRAATVPGPWGTALVLLGAPHRLSDSIVDAFRMLITQRALAETNVAVYRELDHRAHIDQLTALPNRALFFREFTGALEAAVGTEDRMALLLIDLDDFKQVNDTYGHAAGDQLLIQIGDRISEFGGPAAVPGRFGGDEFALLLCDLEHPAAADEIGQQLCRRLREPVLLSQATVQVGASIGIAAAVPGQSAADLMRCADIAMYGAKALGKNRVVRYDEEVHGDVAELRITETRLTQALERDEIVLFYQPILDPHNGRCAAVEAMFRWHQPGVGLHDPAELTAMAERTGDIVRISEHVLAAACQALAGWDGEALGGPADDALAGPLRLFVKVSVQHVLSPLFAQTVADALAGAGLAADRLTLELVDPSRLTDPQVMAVLGEVAATGVRLAVHFGAGDVALADLRAHPIHQLKLDGSLLLSAQSAPTFEIGVSIGRILGLQTVAERLRTTEDLPAELGLGQGPVYAEALAQQDVAEWIKTRAGSLSRA